MIPLESLAVIFFWIFLGIGTIGLMAYSMSAGNHGG